jgi:hypothetical protein
MIACLAIIIQAIEDSKQNAAIGPVLACCRAENDDDLFWKRERSPLLEEQCSDDGGKRLVNSNDAGSLSPSRALRFGFLSNQSSWLRSNDSLTVNCNACQRYYGGMRAIVSLKSIVRSTFNLYYRTHGTVQ